MVSKSVRQGPRRDALISGISMVEKKDPTEIAYEFIVREKKKAPAMELAIDWCRETNQ